MKKQLQNTVFGSRLLEGGAHFIEPRNVARQSRFPTDLVLQSHAPGRPCLCEEIDRIKLDSTRRHDMAQLTVGSPTTSYAPYAPTQNYTDRYQTKSPAYVPQTTYTAPMAPAQPSYFQPTIPAVSCASCPQTMGKLATRPTYGQRTHPQTHLQAQPNQGIWNGQYGSLYSNCSPQTPCGVFQPVLRARQIPPFHAVRSLSRERVTPNDITKRMQSHVLQPSEPVNRMMPQGYLPVQRTTRMNRFFNQPTTVNYTIQRQGHSQGRGSCQRKYSRGRGQYWGRQTYAPY